MMWIRWAATVLIAGMFTLFAWRISEMLSPDAIGMALGMLLGVLSGVPTAALVLVASRSAADRRPAPDYDIDAFAEDVTPYTHTFRRLTGMSPLPTRQQQIDQLRAVLDHIEAQEMR